MSDLISRAQQIKNETIDGANTAERVGSLFEDIAKKVEIINVTYNELVAKINAGELTPFTYYRITDYRTVHYFSKYIGRDKDSWEAVKTIYEVNEGQIEPLIVSAISTNKVSPEAYSEQYPDDIIYYDWNIQNYYTDYSFTNYLDREEEGWVHQYIPGLKGVIYRRIDTKNRLDLSYDWRNVKMRRWKYLSGDVNVDKAIDTEYYVDSYICVGEEVVEINYFSKLTPDPNDYMDSYTFDGKEDRCFDVTVVLNQPKKGNENIGGYYSIIPNVVFRYSDYDYTTNSIMNNIFIGQEAYAPGILSTFCINELSDIELRSCFLSTFPGWNYALMCPNVYTSIIARGCSYSVVTSIIRSSIDNFYFFVGLISDSFIRGSLLYPKGDFFSVYKNDDTRDLRCLEVNYSLPNGSLGIDISGLYDISSRATFKVIRTGNSVNADAYLFVWHANDGSLATQVAPRISFKD